MIHGKKTRRAGAVGTAALAVVAGTAAMHEPPREAGPEARIVSAEVVRAALDQSIPDRPTMTDGIDHYRARLAERPGEAFAQQRLFGLHLLAFRAYGDAAHLDAARDLQQALSRGPARDQPTVLANAATLHLTRHEFRDALEAARAADSWGAGGDAPWVHFDALWASGLHDRARAVLDRPHDPQATAYLARRARVLDADGHVEAARDLFRDVVRNVEAYAEPAPVRAWALVELGHFELHSGSPEEAVRRYREALDVLPGSPAALEGLASVALGVDGNPEAAGALYRRALEHGAHLDIQPLLAEVEEELGHTEEARRLRHHFIVEASRGELRAMHRRPLAFLLAEHDATTAQAVALARRDLAERQDPGAFDALAWTLFRAGETRIASVLSERALRGWSPPPPMLYRAGIIAAANGQADRAEALLEEALDGAVELTPAERREARRVLEEAG